MSEADLEVIATPMSANAARMLANVEALEITDNQRLEGAAGLLTTIRTEKKKVEEQRQSFVRPLNETVARINARFKELLAPLVRADEIVNGKIIAYRQKQEALAKKEQERLERETEKRQAALERKAERAGVEAPIIEVPVVAPPPPMPSSTVTTRKTWEFEIEDAAAVPREFLEVDTVKIRLAIRNGAREIPGVRIYQKMSTAVGSR